MAQAVRRSGYTGGQPRETNSEGADAPVPDFPPPAGPAVGALSAAQERALVEGAQRGDQQALGGLYDAYLPRLYRYCLARVGNAADAEDLAEDIFLKVMGAIDGFRWRGAGGADGSAGSGRDGGQIPFGAWLFRIAHNHVISHHRRTAARGAAAELSEDLADQRRGPQEQVEAKIAIEEVFAAVQRLPDAQREVVLLRFASGLSVAETAAVLGKQEGNVKVLQHKGVKRLKEFLLGAPESVERSDR